MRHIFLYPIIAARRRNAVKTQLLQFEVRKDIKNELLPNHITLTTTYVAISEIVLILLQRYKEILWSYIY